MGPLRRAFFIASVPWLAAWTGPRVPLLPCPRCGARLLTKTEERPPRLVCVDCRQVLPQSVQVPIITLVVRHFLGVMLLLGLVVVPLLVMSLSPWIDRVPLAPRTNLSATR